MVNFFFYVLLLVLQFSGILYAQDQSTTISIPKVDSTQVAATTTVSNIASTSSIVNGSQETVNGTLVNSSNPDLEVPNLNNVQINKTLDLIATSEKTNVSDLDSEFPQSPGNGTKIYYANRTLDTPVLNATGVNANTSTTASFAQPTDNNTKITCTSDMPVDASSPNTTVGKTNSTKLVDTEVTDLLNNTLIETYNVSQIPSSPPNITLNISQINRDTELIEDGQNTEDILRISSKFEGISNSPGVPLVQGQLAAILAGVFVIVSIVAYVGMLTWRRYLENRYGNRQMLINEDEFNDRDDMRHFSI